MNAAIFAAPIPAVYLSPQAISPLSASTTPIALALNQPVDLADPAGTTSSKLSKQDQQTQSLLSQKQDGPNAKRITGPDDKARNTQALVLDGKVDVYV
jgi:hypothetical protein